MIAYDTNILIYALEGTSPWATAAQDIVLQGEREGAILSVLAWQELVTGAVLRNGDQEEVILEALAELGATKFVAVNLAICQRAVALTRAYGRKLYGYDAIHIATALENKAEAFITNDKLLLGLEIRELSVRGL